MEMHDMQQRPHARQWSRRGLIRTLVSGGIVSCAGLAGVEYASAEDEAWCRSNPLLPADASYLDQRARRLERMAHNCGDAPPAVKTFIVFFDFNETTVTPDAQSVISEAANTAKTSGLRVNISGHTDTVGSDSYNVGLSVRRAQAVKDAMAALGIDASGISIEGKGFRDPLVPTGPGVREPQNRRAVIDLSP